MIDAVIGASALGSVMCDGCRKEAEVVLFFTRSATRAEPVSVLALCYECADDARDKIGTRREMPDSAQLSLEEIGRRL